MIKIFKLLFLLPILIVNINSINKENFINSVNDAYEEYEIILDEEREIGDLTLAFGKYKNRYYLSCFLLNNGTSENHYIRIYVNDKLTTYAPDGGEVCGYKLRIDKDSIIKISLYTESSEIVVHTFNSNDLIDSLNLNKTIGNGTGAFPKNKKEISLVTEIRLIILAFFVLIALLSTALIIMYKKSIGRFNKNNKEEPLFDFEKDFDEINTVDVNSENVEEEIYEQNKQEVMDRLFEEFRKGDITEDELNEKLKKLWWKNNE